MTFRNIKTADQIAADKRKAEISNELAKAKVYFVEATQSLLQNAPKEEIDTFPKQEHEARSYLADSTSPTPYLSGIAAKRGITVSELVELVMVKVVAYETAHSALLGEYQAKVKALEAELEVL